MKQFLHQINRKREKNLHIRRLHAVYKKYSSYTMVEEYRYVNNLEIALRVKDIEGDIVECGVWRGGMIAGIAELLGAGRTYHLFDSFEGLPPAKEIDGQRALDWQKDTESSFYYDNCKAEIEFADQAMKLAGVPYVCNKGWFDTTLPGFQPERPIALLRLDADWYDSTMTCLNYLFPLVNPGGLIILDDYYTWDGCSRAVHDYLSGKQSVSRIYSTALKVCYLIKNDP